ncbi:hypothetical protein QR680_009158 [Steinernema hermaphroditum]|uniref:Uncharacterized protein n=1 Tax=Steinernema hermaphroditum TaxID=289476 RepID=A0AA39M8C9_9BILA|nr:hypothetical protein QR680_009158 [Steinernema hermaphroditum]
MVRVIIKGGVWRNTEDEILKAAIMKYGKNQWSRIASLLHRKSAKQCKARWHEWLDPGIKKTEWSGEEDEKLLHLAKLMPTQWRTIAPLVGRTANQCLERYEQLLDDAQKKAEGIDEGEDLGDARKLKPGEIDPTPETKPARPDPVDMDEDELEMLSEARARLANTQGKKAKRKAREKQLTDARRMASLQKRRELRAAGIVVGDGGYRQRKNPSYVDYSAEVPFERQVPAGFYDPSEDTFEKKADDKNSEPKRRSHKEYEERLKDKEKLKKRRAEDTPESIFAKKHEKKRSKLILPAPQISDQEMEEIIKIGNVADSVRNMVDENPTSTLLHDYAASVRDATAARTARTPAASRDVVAEEAENLLALQNVETPLKGGLNTPLHDLRLNSALPQKQVVATPNTILTVVGATPRTAVPGTPSSTLTTPSATPVRDQLNINSEGVIQDVKGELRKALGSLPKPKNDYELLLPEDEEESDDQPDVEEEWIEDASDAAEARAKARALKRIEERKLRTQAFQRDLPRPAKLNEQYTKKATNKTEMSVADDLIKAEMYSLMEWDLGLKTVKPLSVLERSQAAKLIEDEITKHGEPLDDVMWAAIEQCSSELVLSNGKFNRLANLPRRDQMEALSLQFQLYRDWMNRRAKKTAKMEKRLKVKLGGYTNIANGLTKKLTDLQNERTSLYMELDTFKNLAVHENKSIAKRIHKLTLDIEKQHERERELQKRYGALQDIRWKFEQAEVRQQATVSAEAVNYKEQES